jgi:uncharacterized membrane protein
LGVGVIGDRIGHFGRNSQPIKTIDRYGYSVKSRQGMRRSIRPETAIFLAILTVTIIVWVMRGIGILTFLPGLVIWLLLLLTIGAGVINGILSTRR